MRNNLKEILIFIGLLVVMGIVFVGSIWIMDGYIMATSALMVWLFLVMPVMLIGVAITWNIDIQRVD